MATPSPFIPMRSRGTAGAPADRTVRRQSMHNGTIARAVQVCYVGWRTESASRMQHPATGCIAYARTMYSRQDIR